MILINITLFHQKSIGAARCSLAMLYNDWGSRTTSRKLTGTDRRTEGRTGPRNESGYTKEQKVRAFLFVLLCESKRLCVTSCDSIS